MATSTNTSPTIPGAGNVHNSYPELPEQPFFASQMPEAAVVAAFNTPGFTTEVKRMAFAICYNESGEFKKGINATNYGGFQGDSGRWKPEGKFNIIATCVKIDSTQTVRRFLVFQDSSDCFEMTCFKMQERNIFIGAPGINDAADLALHYWRNWVTGDPTAQIPANEEQDFVKVYQHAEAVII